MTFTFRLQTILRLQQGLERKQLKRLQEAALAMQSARSMEEEIATSMGESSERIKASLAHGASGPEFSAAHTCNVWAARALDAAALRTAEAEKKWTAEFRTYRERKMELEKFEGARDGLWQAFQTEETRREQAIADELHSVRVRFQRK